MKNELTLKELLFGEALHNAVHKLKKSGESTTTVLLRVYGHPVTVEKTNDGYIAKGYTEVDVMPRRAYGNAIILPCSDGNDCPVKPAAKKCKPRTNGSVPKILFVEKDVCTPSTWKTAVKNGWSMNRVISEICDCDPGTVCTPTADDVADDLVSAKGRTWRRYTAVRIIANTLSQYIVKTIQTNKMTSTRGNKKFAWFTPFVKLVTANFDVSGKIEVSFKLWGIGDGVNFGPSFLIDPKTKNPEVWADDIEYRICRSLLKKDPDKYVVDWIFALITRVRLMSKDYPNVPESIRSKLLTSRLDVPSTYEHFIAMDLHDRFSEMVDIEVPDWLFEDHNDSTYNATVTGDIMQPHEVMTLGETIISPLKESECPVFTKVETTVLKCIQNLLESLNQ